MTDPASSQLIDDAHEAIRQAHRLLLDPTPQSIDFSRGAFATAVSRLNALHGMLQSSPDLGRGLLPSMTALHTELERVTLLLERAAFHRANLLQCMLAASHTEGNFHPEPPEPGRRVEMSA